MTSHFMKPHWNRYEMGTPWMRATSVAA